MSKLMKLLTDSGLQAQALDVTLPRLAASLLMALVLSAVMMLVYRFCHDSLTYSRKFNITLMMLSLASCLLLALIAANPALSLGALGALSICRIRTNTRDPRDLGFVFWSLLIGISSTLQAYLVGLAGTVLLSIVMLTLGRWERRKDGVTVVVRGKKEMIPQVQAVLGQISGSKIRSKNVFQDSFELVYRLKSADTEESGILDIFNHMQGIDSVNVLAPQTEVA